MLKHLRLNEGAGLRYTFFQRGEGYVLSSFSFSSNLLESKKSSCLSTSSGLCILLPVQDVTTNSLYIRYSSQSQSGTVSFIIGESTYPPIWLPFTTPYTLLVLETINFAFETFTMIQRTRFGTFLRDRLPTNRTNVLPVKFLMLRLRLSF